jgi:hypothetical protein
MGFRQKDLSIVIDIYSCEMFPPERGQEKINFNVLLGFRLGGFPLFDFYEFFRRGCLNIAHGLIYCGSTVFVVWP